MSESQSLLVDDSGGALYSAQVDDDLFDDTCDFGQFMLNPSWYMFVTTRSSILSFWKQQSEIQSISSKANRSRWLHLQRPLYVFFVITGWTGIFWKAYPLWRMNEDLSNVHLSLGYFVFAACLISWKAASSTSPGEIKLDNMWRFDNYPYDNLMYTEDAICATLQQKKLARSKYDRYTNKHIPRFDHFCGWLQRPIGEENYRQFLAFVTVHALMCAYGSVFMYILIVSPRSSGHQAVSSQITGLLHRDIPLTALFLFLLTATVPLVGFLGFHMYLIANGMTTNECHKWKLIRSRHEKAKRAFKKWQLEEKMGKNEETIRSESIAVEMNHSKQVTVLDPGPCPKNQYDNGIFENMMEILNPRSLRHHPSPKSE